VKPQLTTKRNAAMTLFEVGVVVAVVMVLIIFFLPKLLRPRTHSFSPVSNSCINNLKQIGLAYRIWEGDNGDILPMGISVTNGGSMEMVATGNVAKAFLVMSNELSTPRLLYCPADTARSSENAFSKLSTFNISYFVSVDTTNDANPQMILSGDSHLEIGGATIKSGLAMLGTNDLVVWSASRHIKEGNIGLADGSVQTTTSKSLQTLLQQTGLATNRFAIP
jgi:hypothetical protein